MGLLSSGQKEVFRVRNTKLQVIISIINIQIDLFIPILILWDKQLPGPFYKVKKKEIK